MSARDYRRIAWENLSGRWWISALVCFVASLLGGISSGSASSIESEDLEFLFYNEELQWLIPMIMTILVIALVAAIITFIIGGVVELGLKRYFLEQHDGLCPSFGKLFSQFPNFGKAFLLRLLSTIYIMLWTFLFIIPGIIKAYSYAMAPYIMAEHPELSANECITRSKQMMDGYKFKLFCVSLSFIGWAFLCIFTCGLGTPFLHAYEEAAVAAFYRNVSAGELF